MRVPLTAVGREEPLADGTASTDSSRPRLCENDECETWRRPLTEVLGD